MPKRRDKKGVMTRGQVEHRARTMAVEAMNRLCDIITPVTDELNSDGELVMPAHHLARKASPKDVIAAAIHILDRAVGKPEQRAQIAHSLSEQHIEALRQLARVPKEPPLTIEARVVETPTEPDSATDGAESVTGERKASGEGSGPIRPEPSPVSFSGAYGDGRDAAKEAYASRQRVRETVEDEPFPKRQGRIHR